MKVGVLTAMFLTLLIGFPIASSAGLAPDNDGDGVPDVMDNCDKLANAGTGLNGDCDTDQDGYGNKCDGDMNGATGAGQGAVNLGDFNAWKTEFNLGAGANLKADLNCSGGVNLGDFNAWKTIFNNPSLYSSGLSCAGTTVGGCPN